MENETTMVVGECMLIDNDASTWTPVQAEVKVEYKYKDLELMAIAKDSSKSNSCYGVELAYFDWDRLNYGRKVLVLVPFEDVKITKK